VLLKDCYDLPKKSAAGDELSIKKDKKISEIMMIAAILSITA
jgi:hypothetical protein